MGLEGAIELARRVGARPQDPLVHAHRLHVLGEAHSHSLPVTLQNVVTDLPRAYPANHREHECTAWLQQSCALLRDDSEVGYAVERPEVRVGSIEQVAPFEP